MAGKENEQKSGKEVWGRRAVYGGIIAGVIGIIVAPELAIAGVGLAAAGVIFENSAKQKPKQASAV